MPQLTRRAVLAGACTTCAVAVTGAVTGCASYGSGPPAAPPAGSGVAAGGGPLAAAADVPVGGGVVVAAADTVITQPTAGVFTAFSATCTHQGCVVAAVAGGTINCDCHGSTFSITDGSVVTGPAKAPLPARRVAVRDGQILPA